MSRELSVSRITIQTLVIVLGLWTGAIAQTSLRVPQVSLLPYNDTIKQLISENMPREIADVLVNSEVFGINLDSLVNYFQVAQFHPNKKDSTEYLLIYRFIRYSTLQMYRKVDNKWELASELQSVGTGSNVQICEIDLDCDGRNEILIRGLSGLGKNQPIQIAKILSFYNNMLTDLTSYLIDGGKLIGYPINFYIHANSVCLDSIMLWVGNYMDARNNSKIRWLAYDKTTNALKLIREIPLYDMPANVPPEKHIDVSYLPYDEEIKELISKNIPSDLESAFTDDEWGVALDALGNYIRIVRYPDSLTDVHTGYLLIHISDGLGNATLQLYKADTIGWVFQSEVRNIAGGYLPQISQIDIDCDGTTEIMIQNAVGIGGMTQIDILRLSHDSLINLTPYNKTDEPTASILDSGQLVGRLVNFYTSPTSCVDSIVVSIEDGPNRFEVTKKRWYRFDNTAHIFRLVKEESAQNEH